MMGPILSVTGLTKRFGGLTATDRVDLDIAPGELRALIGPNGAGKTTLLAQLSGELRSDAGRVFFEGNDVTRMPVQRRAALGLGRSYQISSVFLNFTVIENVALAVQARSGNSLRFWRDARRDPRLRDPASHILETMGLAPRARTPAADLSYGEQRQLEIAMLLATGSRLLLMDEPMAGLGAEESKRLTEMIRSLKGNLTILLVEHDMNAVFALADRITVLVYGRVIATDRVEGIRADPEVRRVYFG